MWFWESLNKRHGVWFRAVPVMAERPVTIPFDFHFSWSSSTVDVFDEHMPTVIQPKRSDAPSGRTIFWSDDDSKMNHIIETFFLLRRIRLAIHTFIHLILLNLLIHLIHLGLFNHSFNHCFAHKLHSACIPLYQLVFIEQFWLIHSFHSSPKRSSRTITRSRAMWIHTIK